MRTAFAAPTDMEPAARGWTDGRVAYLRQVARDGGSFTDAARGLGVSRSAVAGKAYREGVSFDCDYELRSERARRNIARRWGREPQAACA